MGLEAQPRLSTQAPSRRSTSRAKLSRSSRNLPLRRKETATRARGASHLQAFQGKIVFTFFTYITYYCDMSLWKQLGVIGVMMASPDASAVGFSNTVSNNIPDIPVVFVNTDSIGLLMVSAMSGARARITNGDSCEKYGTDGSGSLGVQIYLALMGAIALAMAIFFTVKGPQVFLRKNQNSVIYGLSIVLLFWTFVMFTFCFPGADSMAIEIHSFYYLVFLFYPLREAVVWLFGFQYFNVLLIGMVSDSARFFLTIGMTLCVTGYVAVVLWACLTYVSGVISNPIDIDELESARKTSSSIIVWSVFASAITYTVVLVVCGVRLLTVGNTPGAEKIKHTAMRIIKFGVVQVVALALMATYEQIIDATSRNSGNISINLPDNIGLKIAGMLFNGVGIVMLFGSLCLFILNSRMAADRETSSSSCSSSSSSTLR